MEPAGRYLDALRQESDPLADSVIKRLVATGQLSGINRQLRTLRVDGDRVEDVPDFVQDYLSESRKVPETVDPRLLTRVQKFFHDDGVQLAASTGIGSMVEAYAARPAAMVLSATHRLDEPERRMQETFQFVLHMMEPRAFGPGSRLIPAVQKVRLIHASIRHLLSTDRSWDQDAYGVPINQEDMLGTTTLFSVGTLRIMRRLRIHITPAEAEDYYHLWRVTGQMLGVRAELLPASWQDADRLHDLLLQRSWGPTAEGVALTRALIKRYQAGTGPRYRGLISAVIRLMVEPQVADWMQVPRTRWSMALKPGLRLVELLESIEDRSRLATRVLDRGGQRLLGAQIRSLNEGGTRHFDVPAVLDRRLPASATRRSSGRGLGRTRPAGGHAAGEER